MRENIHISLLNPYPVYHKSAGAQAGIPSPNGDLQSLSYDEDSISVHQLDSLASLCPMYHGLAVYQARALLDAISYFEYDPSTCEYAVPSQEDKKEIEVQVDEWRVIVYPNPSRDYIYVLKSRGQQELLNLTLRNSIGVVVKKLDMRELDTYVKLEISDLIPGVYYLEVENVSNKEVHCVIVQ